jgi:hypothetical protein
MFYWILLFIKRQWWLLPSQMENVTIWKPLLALGLHEKCVSGRKSMKAEGR